MYRMKNFIKSYFWIPSLIALVLYFQSIWFGVSWGDDWLVTCLPAKDFHFMVKIFYDNRTFPGVHFCPVYFLQCYLINLFLGEYAYPLGFHIYSVFVHSLACLIATYVIYKITSNKLISVLIVSLWTVHPLNMQIITRLGCGPAQLASGMFCLSFILCFLKALEEKNLSRKIVFVILGSVFYLCSMTTHEQAFLFPFLVLLISFYLKGNKLYKDKNNLYTVLSPLLLLIPVYLAWRMFACRGMIYETSNELIKWTEVGTVKDILFRAYWLAPQILVHYLRLFFWPDFLAASKADWYMVGRTVFDPYSIFCQILVSCLIVGIVVLYKKIPLFSIGMTWFFLSMILVSQIMPLFVLIDEHYCYISILGIFLSVFGLIHYYMKNLSKTIIILCVLPIFCLLIGRTWLYIPSGRDFLSQYIYLANDAPEWIKVQYIAQAIDYAYSHNRVNELPEDFTERNVEKKMIMWIKKNINVKPDLSYKFGPVQMAYNYLFYKSILRHLYEHNAVNEFNMLLNQAIEVKKDNWLGWYETAEVLKSCKQWDLAWQSLNKAIELAPKCKLIYSGIFVEISLNANRFNQAEQLVNNYISLFPDSSYSYLFAGFFYNKFNLKDKAAKYYSAAVGKNDFISISNHELIIYAVNFFLSNGMYKEAENVLKLLLGFDPNNVEVRDKLKELNDLKLKHH